eukprot:15715778-Heterocapsa_arctica.AAC.1
MAATHRPPTTKLITKTAAAPAEAIARRRPSTRPGAESEAGDDGGRAKHHPPRAERARRGTFTCLVKGASKGEAVFAHRLS